MEGREQCLSTLWSNFLWFKPLAPSLRLFIILIRSWGWEKHTRVYDAKQQNRRQPVHRSSDKPKKLDCKIPCGLQTWFEAFRQQCSGRFLRGLPASNRLTAFPAHGHCIQPCESEQVTHTSLSHPAFITTSPERKGGAKAHVPEQSEWNMTSSSALLQLLP